MKTRCIVLIVYKEYIEYSRIIIRNRCIEVSSILHTFSIVVEYILYSNKRLHMIIDNYIEMNMTFVFVIFINFDIPKHMKCIYISKHIKRIHNGKFVLQQK